MCLIEARKNNLTDENVSFLYYMYMEYSFKSMKICRIHVYHCSLKSLSDMLAKHPWYYLHVAYFQVSGTTYSSSRTCPSSSLCHLPISSRSRKDLLV